MFDAATLREELNAMIDEKGRLLPGFKPEYAVKIAKKLRDAEYRENGYVTARNGVTGY
jgi:hypothetical protein